MGVALDAGVNAGVGADPGTGQGYLAIRDVGKQFGSFVALDRVSLDISSGELVSFLGPSGCGKTTLLRAIAGLDPPTIGRIIQAGRDITALPPSERDFGIVFQSYALFPNLTVAENIGYGLRGTAWPKARKQQRVTELLELIGLLDQIAKYPAQLSGGQQQRVALARALASEPGLLLLDEPLSALDAIVRLHLRQEIRALQQRLGVTTIMVTHDQEEALSVSDRIVVMSQGRIEQIGTPEEIYGAPATPFVAGFVGRSARFSAKIHTPAGHITSHGLVLPAMAAAPLLYGEEVEAFIRPEDVELFPLSAQSAGSFEARITGLEFLGPVCRVSLEANGLRFEADIAPSVAAAFDTSSGARLLARFRPERLMVFRSNG
jgi:iron(III) transport system ATP-binding protein